MNMERLPIPLSSIKVSDLTARLNGFWANKTWQIRECPLLDANQDLPDKLPTTIRFDCTSPALRAEIQYACWQKLERKEWAVTTLWARSISIHHIVEWLNETQPTVNSLLDKSLQHWELSFRTYLLERGKFKEVTQERLMAHHQKKVVRIQNQHIVKLRGIYKLLRSEMEPISVYERDIWDCKALGLHINPSRPPGQLNFTEFTIPWLKSATQQFIKYSISIHSVGECQNRIGTLRRFCRFLAKHHPSIQPHEIDRPLVLDYLGVLASSQLVPNTRIRHISQIRTFLELCAREGWADIPNTRLIYQEDFPKHTRSQPRFIPEYVMQQLNQHIEALDPLYMRMLLVLQECGMRVGELCRMNFNCISQDMHGDWFLKYYQYKMKKDHSIPITRELAGVIQEQQREMKEKWGDSCKFLFCDKKGKVVKQSPFSRALNRLANEKDIRDASGQLWHFQSHAFRHTVGTRMVNSGVPHHIIQRFLGHESPEMTARYATIHDETLKKEFEKFKGSKVVDVKGRTIEPGKSDLQTTDLQWFKENILAQALPNGTCALPVVMGSCPHANACLTCTHFRTDVRFLDAHKEQLEQTQQMKQKAMANGWTRQVENHETVESNLKNIIAGLEADSDGKS